METSTAKNILRFVSQFQNKAQAVKRYVGNPYVNGDNVAEHLSRLARLAVCIAPDLKSEFPNEPDLVGKVISTLIIHDDDEVIIGFDIPTAMKMHNANDGEEVRKFSQAVSMLGEKIAKHLVSLFASFRKKDSLVAKIAKVLDNVAGNQLVIEQETGLINPDQARFAIEYVQKVKGVSKTTDALIDAQIAEIVEFRRNALNRLQELPSNAKKLLQVNILEHVLDREKINKPLSEL